MFEKRPIWGLILGLNVCILIWLISVQEPVMFDANTAAISSSSSSSSSGSNSGSSNNYIINSNNNGWSRDLLSKSISGQSNEYADDLTVTAATLTTFNFSNSNSNHKHLYNSSNNNYTTDNIKENTIPKTYETIKTTTKTSDLSADLQSLTSSLGTGVLDTKTRPTPSWATLTAAVSSALPAEDFNQLIDLHNFEFLMPQPVCSHHIEALILIHSAPKNYEKRQVIRETWGSITHHRPVSPLRVLFLLGAVGTAKVQEDLENENNLYRDIIQGSFIDDYRNMTYKHIMAFKWFLYNCPQAQILIKVDDDVYVNTPQLIKYLREQQQNDMQLNNNNNYNYNLKTKYKNENTNNKPTINATTEAQQQTNRTANSNSTTTTTTSTLSSILQKLNIFSSDDESTLTAAKSSSLSSSSSSHLAFNASHELFNHPQNLLFCQKIIGSLVKRSYRSKWRVSFKEYSERYYPPYCPGYAIIYSPDIIFRLYVAAQKSKYFWIDDVHITGVLAQQTNTTITTSSHYVLYSDECDDILTGKTDLSSTEFLFAWHSISAQQIKLLWHLQMMSIHSLDDLHYKKSMMNDVYEVEQQSGNFQDSNSISSLYTYTSANGFR
ncbi:uncharacterized protein ACRADG_001474 isoform 1-T8 [Cochliomyia hominivorax]